MDIIIATLAACFVLAAIDFWVDLGFYRGILAAILAGAALAALTGRLEPGWLITSALACGFATVAVIQVLERVTALTIRSRR